MCQTCVDEGRLSQETYEKIEAFCERWPSAEFGPGHILLSDCNVGNENIEFCLRQCDLVRQQDAKWVGGPWYECQAEGELNATATFLRELLKVPGDER